MSLRTRFACIAVCLLVPGLARADGLLNKLPDDRAFVKYDLDLTLEGQPQSITGSVTLKSVGQTFEDGEKCRWIELELTIKGENNAGQTTLYKFLAPEKNLTEKGTPLEKIVRGWYKVDEQPVQQFTDAKQAGLTALAVFLTGPLKDARDLDKQFEDSKLGNLECTGVRGTSEHSFAGEQTVKVTHEIRRHEKAPFGVVRSDLQFELFDKEGKSTLKGSVRLKLVDVGKDATSALPDSQ